MKKILYMALTALILGSCAQIETPEQDANCTLSALKAYVCYDASDLSKREEVNLLSGMFVEDKGLISYTFPEDQTKFGADALTRCRIEATIPSTAVLELTDADGAGLGHGFDTFYDLSSATIYFKIVAANGDFNQYKLTTRRKK